MQKNLETINFFLWVSHGTNVSDDSAYFYLPFETKINYLVMYSKPTKNETYDTFVKLIQNPCSLITGSCPFLPILQPNGKKLIYLPPLGFEVKDDDSQKMKNAMGLYHFTIRKIGFEACHIAVDGPATIDNIIKETRIVGYNDIFRKFRHELFTYSSIFHIIKEYCKQFSLSLDEISLGILSCQSQIDKYLNKNNMKHNIKTFVPKVLIDSTPSYKLKETIGATDKFDLLCYPYETDINIGWDALGGIKTQGCAINILSFYGIFKENEARQRVFCLPSTGTSIFKILDYILIALHNRDLTLAKNEKSPDPALMIVRYFLKEGIYIMVEILLTKCLLYHITFNYVVIFKLYDNIMHKNIYSHMGHTVSLCFNHVEEQKYSFTFIDPQHDVKHNIVIDMKNRADLAEYQDMMWDFIYEIITNKYPSKQYIDLIFYESDFFTLSDIHKKLDIDYHIDYHIIYDRNDGGGLKKHNGKTRGRGRGRNNTKKNNSKKSIIDIIKEIDRQNGVKTALNNSNIMENPHKFENPNSSQNSLGL
jgi:hypothetical protein